MYSSARLYFFIPVYKGLQCSADAAFRILIAPFRKVFKAYLAQLRQLSDIAPSPACARQPDALRLCCPDSADMGAREPHVDGLIFHKANHYSHVAAEFRLFGTAASVISRFITILEYRKHADQPCRNLWR
jgi:hypothetical protein